MPAKFNPPKLFLVGLLRMHFGTFTGKWILLNADGLARGRRLGLAIDLAWPMTSVMYQCVLANKEKFYWDLVPMVVVCS